MSDEDIVLQVQSPDHAFDVVGLSEETVVVSMAAGLAPAAQIHSDAAENVGEPRYDFGPRAPGAAPVVDEHQSQAAFTLYLSVNL